MEKKYRSCRKLSLQEPHLDANGTPGITSLSVASVKNFSSDIHTFMMFGNDWAVIV